MTDNTNIFEKLNHHQLPIDESYWAEMENRLQNSRPKTVPLWMWVAGAGIAASLALLFFMPTFDVDNEISGTQMAQIELISTDEYANRTQMPAENIEKKQSGETQIALSTKNNSVYKNLRESVPSASSACLETEETANNDVPDNIVENATEKNTPPEKRYELQPKHNDALTAQQVAPAKKRHKKSWQIAAAIGSGSSNASSENPTFALNKNDNLYDFSSPSYSTDRNDKTQSIDDVYTFPKAIHLPPLSAGLTFRKNFNKYFALETGLTYTFLQSKFEENTEWMHRDATLKLHYIGIPLNAVVYLLNKPKWNIYCSLGGMAEKGIMLDYVQHTIYRYNWNPPMHTIDLQDNIPKMQWALNTSFGIGYKLHRNIGIYFEPRVMYYFKNNQPVSARTEMPLLLGLNAGLRFDF